jgi:hypothetical protein
MDPVTIGLAIGTLKSAVSAAKSVQEISHGLESLWKAEQDHHENKKKPKKKPPETRMQQVLRIRTGDGDEEDETSVSTVADDIINEKNNKLALEALAKEIDKKWGQGTWEEIQTERDKRIKARDERIEEAKKKAKAKAEHDRKLLHSILVEGGKAVVIVTVVVGMIYFLYWAAQKGGSM